MMKWKLLLLTIFSVWISNAQDAPVIDGDTMLCPYSNGTATITNGETYDTYQWYFKYWFLSDDYQAIPGATSASFTYDWYTYDQALFKVVVTSGSTTLESNTIQIDSYAWTGLLVTHNASDNVEIDGTNGAFLMCDGDTIENTINSPYTIVQWYKDDVAIEGATDLSYTVTEPGTYKVIAAPDYCPDVTNSVTFSVQENSNCNLGVDDNTINKIKLANNPVTDILYLTNIEDGQLENVSIINMNGQQVSFSFIGNNNANINVGSLTPGMYILQGTLNNTPLHIKFIKK